MDVDSTSAEKDHSCPCWGILWPYSCASFCVFFFLWCTKQQILCFSWCFPAIFLAVYLQGGEPKPSKTIQASFALRCLQPWTCRLFQKIVKRRQRRQEAIGKSSKGWCFWEEGRFAMRGWWGWKILETWGCFLFIFFLRFWIQKVKKVDRVFCLRIFTDRDPLL